MFFNKRLGWLRPSKSQEQNDRNQRQKLWRRQQYQQQLNDQLPFLSRSRFSALPHFRDTASNESQTNLTLFIAILYVIDMFGVFPFVTLPALLVELGFFGIPLVISVVVLQIYTSFLLSECWTMAESLDTSFHNKNRSVDKFVITIL